jgi:hypothetical protein
LQIKSLIGNKDLIKRLYSNHEDFIDFLRSALVNIKYDLFSQSEIAGDDLYQIIYVSNSHSNEDVSINDKFFLQDVLSNCLERVIEITQGFDWAVNYVYLKNRKDVANITTRITLTDKANSVMRKGILKYPESYLSKIFIRYAYMPPGDVFVFDPFIIDYFEYIEYVKSLLSDREVAAIFNLSEDGRQFFEIITKYFLNYIGNEYKEFKIIDTKELNIVKKRIAKQN